MDLDRLTVRRLLDLENKLDEAAIDAFIEHVRQAYELAHLVYLCPSFPGYCLSEPFIRLTYPTSWIDHYRREGYVSVDPVIKSAARSIMPMDWTKLPKGGEKKVLRLFSESLDAGIGRNGVTVPVRGPTNGVWAVFCATAHDSDTQWISRRYELVRDLVHVAHFIHQKAADLNLCSGGTPDLNAITKREIEALQWSAEGKNTEDIGVLLAVSTETARAHLDSARYKLDALNRVHAVAKAIRAGLIS